MTSLAFAKLVATPTDASWSQVYNAGNLFACLTLTSKLDEDVPAEARAEEVSLPAVGKEVLSILESEFFTLELKTLDAIKNIIGISVKGVPANIIPELCLAFFKDKILYVFILGAGKAIMKRGAKTGTLLEKPERPPQGGETTDREFSTASGYLENNDTIVLQTSQFAKNISAETLASALDLALPNDVAEALSPHMHEEEDGGQAAIIIAYHGVAQTVSDEETITGPVFATDLPEEEKDEPAAIPSPAINAEPENPDEEFTDQTPAHLTSENIASRIIIAEREEIDIILPQENTKTTIPNKSALHSFKLPGFVAPLRSKIPPNLGISNLTHTKKLILSVVIIIAILLTASIIFTKKRQADAQNLVLFQSVYTPALKNYEDGLGLKSINKEFANKDFLQAEKIIKDNVGKFKQNSDEREQLAALLTKVESELQGTTSSNVITPKTIDIGTNDFLSVVKNNRDGLGFTKDGDNTYFVTGTAVVRVDNNGKKENIIENQDDDWEKAVGISFYQGNIYVLDQENGVIKFSPGSDSFGKSSYFRDPKPNMSNASSIAIDGSVFILLKNGTIQKYTSGRSDGFKTSGLDKPLSNPTKIATDINTDSLYVLDRGNGRIVTLSKDGSFQAQYNAEILKSAKDFEVDEENGTILVLAQDKFWEIPL